MPRGAPRRGPQRRGARARRHGQDAHRPASAARLRDDAVTESIVATRSAQALPLAAVAALLPPDAAVPGEPIELFRAVRRTLEERAAGRPLIVAVDDAHLVDPPSAALLHHLESTAAARLLVAVRSGEPVEDAITALWRDGAARRIDVQPLGPEDVATLLRAVLDGEIDAASARRLWQITGGNPLYLHEIVNEALQAGTLKSCAACGGGTATCGSARACASSSSCGWPVWTTTSAPWCRSSRSASRAARRRRPGGNGAGDLATATPGLRRDRSPSGRTFLSLDHPLFAEVVRTAMPTGERKRWCRFLAESADPAGDDDVSCSNARCGWSTAASRPTATS